jgi:hypothetical protein
MARKALVSALAVFVVVLLAIQFAFPRRDGFEDLIPGSGTNKGTFCVSDTECSSRTCKQGRCT